ncbi:conserved hypothetical protein [Staphylococcus capitis]|nr:conserved hypothetical protein [Staphylococcus capitis]
MIKFENLTEAFEWTFSEREDMTRLKFDFDLNDEVKSVSDITKVFEDETLEDYLLENSYLVKYEDGYAFFEQEDLEDNDDLVFELAGILGENEG